MATIMVKRERDYPMIRGPKVPAYAGYSTETSRCELYCVVLCGNQVSYVQKLPFGNHIS